MNFTVIWCLTGLGFKRGCVWTCFVWGTWSEVWKEKSRLAMASYQTNWFKCPLKSGSSLPTNCATFWNEKFWCGTLFLHKNKTRNVRRSEKAQLNKRDLSDPTFPIIRFDIWKNLSIHGWSFGTLRGWTISHTQFPPFLKFLFRAKLMNILFS